MDVRFSLVDIISLWCVTTLIIISRVSTTKTIWRDKLKDTINKSRETKELKIEEPNSQQNNIRYFSADISIITLNGNSLNIPIKRKKL